MESKQYGVGVRTWDHFAGEGGEWVWNVFLLGEYTEAEMKIIINGLKAAGKWYFYGEVNPQEAEG